MRPKTLILFIVAIGCGLVASIGVSQYMEKAKGSANASMETSKIYVATTEISAGERLDAKNVRLEEWPKDRVPEGAVSDLKELEEKFPRSRLYKGEAILFPKLSDTKDGNLLQTIPPGFVLVAVKVDETTSGGGLLRPGDRVDLVVFLRKSAEIPETGTRTILRDVNVFAVQGETERQVDKQGMAREVRTVSLLVTPKQALSVTLAKEVGVLSLTLRRPGDTIEEIEGAENLASLLGREGDNANEDKKKRKESPDAGLAEWLTNNAASVETSAAPAPDMEPKATPKFVMTIRTPNGDRKFHFKEFDSAPEEIDEDAQPAPLRPAAAAVTRPIRPVAKPRMADAKPQSEFPTEQPTADEINTDQDSEMTSEPGFDQQEEAPTDQPGT